jgi:hypothetical protein
MSHEVMMSMQTRQVSGIIDPLISIFPSIIDELMRVTCILLYYCPSISEQAMISNEWALYETASNLPVYISP